MAKETSTRATLQRLDREEAARRDRRSARVPSSRVMMDSDSSTDAPRLRLKRAFRTNLRDCVNVRQAVVSGGAKGTPSPASLAARLVASGAARGVVRRTQSTRGLGATRCRTQMISRMLGYGGGQVTAVPPASGRADRSANFGRRDASAAVSCRRRGRHVVS